MSDTTSSRHVTDQPMSLNSMDPYCDHFHDEKRHGPPSCASYDCECANAESHPYRARHRSNLRRFFIPVSLIIATIAMIVFICTIRNLAFLGVFISDYKTGVDKRATDSTTGGSTFVNNKCVLFILGAVGLVANANF
jgi:hypothetical protein